jgi:histidine triad (HIT) family protein
MSTIFSKIIAGEIPCHKIHEDDAHIAFLDISPLVMGHVLCLPKAEIDYIFDMSEDQLKALWAFTMPVAKAIKSAIPCKRIGTSVIGLEVPHTHIHLVPINSADDLNFTRPKLQPSQDELAQIAAKIKAFI